jgi:hypothetical protein
MARPETNLLLYDPQIGLNPASIVSERFARARKTLVE